MNLSMQQFDECSLYPNWLLLYPIYSYIFWVIFFFLISKEKYIKVKDLTDRASTIRKKIEKISTKMKHEA